MTDAIIITISLAMLKEKGYRNWRRNFLEAMAKEDCTYWMKQGAQPKRELLYVYLCIGGKIRFRANFVMSEGRGHKTFSDGKTDYARAWVILAGPVTYPPAPVHMKGFQGFRYTEKLF